MSAQDAYNRLTAVQRLSLCDAIFQILEYDSFGNPGNEWSADTVAALGELFSFVGVIFTPP